MVARAGEAIKSLQAMSAGEQDAGDHQGPPRRASPPSPLRKLMGFS